MDYEIMIYWIESQKNFYFPSTRIKLLSGILSHIFRPKKFEGLIKNWIEI